MSAGEGGVHKISARDLVAGDVVLLETGDVVPTDGRLIQASNLRVQEAALTGESEPIEKDAASVYRTEKALGDRRNMVFSGTIVVYGHGEALTIETGMDTARHDRQPDPVGRAGADATAEAARLAG